MRHNCVFFYYVGCHTGLNELTLAPSSGDVFNSKGRLSGLKHGLLSVKLRSHTTHNSDAGSFMYHIVFISSY